MLPVFKSVAFIWSDEWVIAVQAIVLKKYSEIQILQKICTKATK